MVVDVQLLPEKVVFAVKNLTNDIKVGSSIPTAILWFDQFVLR